jgi:hypothetical protein
MGHSNANTTARYAQISERIRRQSGDQIESLLGGFQLRWEED